MKLKSKKLSVFWIRTKLSARKHPGLFAVYWILRLLVVGVMVMQLFSGNYANVFLCVLTLVLFLIPSFVERRIKVDVPDTLEVIILLFIFAADILGEIQEYYITVPGWDTMLHTVNGFLCAAIGIALIDILNRHDKFCIKMSPAFVALVAFCFSMTIGVLWEFIEFAGDMLLRVDMQKDTFITSISSVSLHPEGRNIPVIIDNISKTVIYGDVNGQPVEIVMNGYLDIGIIDTMKDLIVNFIGAVIFSIIGSLYIKRRGVGKSGKFVSRFIPTKISSADTAAGIAHTKKTSRSKEYSDLQK